MEFTDNFVGNLLKISPCGSLIAHIEEDELLVRDFGSLIILMRGALPSFPHSLVWSTDSQIVAAQYERSVLVWKFEKQENLEKPLPPVLSVLEVFPIERIILHGLYLLVFTEMELHVRIWRLGEKQPIGILPGASVQTSNLIKSNDGKVALYHPVNGNIVVYDFTLQHPEKPIKTMHTEEPILGLELFDDSNVIAWSSRIHLQIICYDEAGKACYYRPTCDTFGLVSVESTPLLLAFLDARDTLHLFNKYTRTFFRPVTLSLAQARQQSSLVFYKEIQTGKYEAQYANYISVGERPVPSGIIIFDHTQRFFAVRNTANGNIAWVFQINAGGQIQLLSLLVQESMISMMAWHPTASALFLVCQGGAHVYSWQPDGCRCLQVPEGGASFLQFRQDGIGEMLLQGNRSFCLAFPEWIQ